MTRFLIIMGENYPFCPIGLQLPGHPQPIRGEFTLNVLPIGRPFIRCAGKFLQVIYCAAGATLLRLTRARFAGA